MSKIQTIDDVLSQFDLTTLRDHIGRREDEVAGVEEPDLGDTYKDPCEVFAEHHNFQYLVDSWEVVKEDLSKLSFTKQFTVKINCTPEDIYVYGEGGEFEFSHIETETSKGWDIETDLEDQVNTWVAKQLDKAVPKITKQFFKELWEAVDEHNETHPDHFMDYQTALETVKEGYW